MPTHGNVRRHARNSPHRDRACDAACDAGDDMVTGLLLAHQGGWDETLLVLVPIAVIVALLHVARRRTKQP
jgi:hypothetical protein